MKIIKEPFKFLIQYRFPFLAFMIYIVSVNTILHEGCPFEIVFEHLFAHAQTPRSLVVSSGTYQRPVLRF